MTGATFPVTPLDPSYRPLAYGLLSWLSSSQIIFLASYPFEERFETRTHSLRSLVLNAYLRMFITQVLKKTAPTLLAYLIKNFSFHQFSNTDLFVLRLRLTSLNSTTTSNTTESRPFPRPPARRTAQAHAACEFPFLLTSKLCRWGRHHFHHRIVCLL